MAKGSLNKPPGQKVDNGGSYVTIPRALLRSPAFLSLSYRARSALLVLMERFNGYNNGRIGLSVRDLGAALGAQNHKANSAALGELQSRGIIECVIGANYQQSKAREYRLTFIETGTRPRLAATNEWRSWSPEDGNSSVEAAASRKRKCANLTTTRRKLSVESIATPETEMRVVEGGFRVATTAAHIDTSSQGSNPVYAVTGNSLRSASELRLTLNDLISSGGATAASVAKSIGMPGGTMSKFRNGRNLPSRFHVHLQMELGRRDAFAWHADRPQR